MQLLCGLSHFQTKVKACALTIGNFDGVHPGHQAVICNLADKAREMGLPVVVMLFEPQPLEYFRPDSQPARLSRLRDKILMLTALPVDYALVLRFGQALARLDPIEFVQKILVDCLNTKYLVVGDDFRFGRKRSGDFQLLQSLASQFDFVVEKTASRIVDGKRISSTLIRDLLALGDLDSARHFLGRPYSIAGRVIHGKKNGRSIGFPTANIAINRKNAALRGVFAVTMTRFQNREWAGVANVGVRPTFGGESKVFLEVHLFDFDSDLYGRCVEIHFHQKIRDEMRFASIDELVRQISRDCLVARGIHEKRTGPSAVAIAATDSNHKP